MLEVPKCHCWFRSSIL